MTSRIPNFFHFLLLLAVTFFAFLFSEGVVLALAHGAPLATTLADQRLQLAVNVFTYLLALGAAWFGFPLLWQRTFVDGMRWNFGRVRPLPALAGGVALGFVSQAVTVFLPHPKDLPIEALFHNRALIWFIVLFGVVLGPLFEEIVFRGFLLPSLAIAVDWLRLPRNPDPAVSLQTLGEWQASTTFSRGALAVSTIVTSLLFALMHAPQLGWTWPAIALLASVSVVLCVVRLRTGSVAASTLVHGAYNLSVFLTLFVGTGGFRHLDRG